MNFKGTATVTQMDTLSQYRVRCFLCRGPCSPDVRWVAIDIWYPLQLAKAQLDVMLCTSGTHMSNRGLDSQPATCERIAGKWEKCEFLSAGNRW